MPQGIIKYNVSESLLKFVCFASSAMPRVNKLFFYEKPQKSAFPPEKSS